MRLPPPKRDAQKKRLKEWENWLRNFRSQYTTNGSRVKFSYIPNAAWLLNDLYWRLAEQYLRPVLRTEQEKKEEHLIHPYKIISASEIAIMMAEPINVKGDPEAEKKIAAGLAWFVATQIIEGWETGSTIKVTAAQITGIAGYKEHIEDSRRYPESFAAEHIQWLTMLNVTVEKPLLLNAQCWRLFYLSCLALAGKGKLK